MSTASMITVTFGTSITDAQKAEDVEARALAIALFYALGTGLGGAVFAGYLLGAGLSKPSASPWKASPALSSLAD